MRNSLFRAFQSRNYRLYFFGQTISLVGTWMQRTAVYWLVYAKTQSAWMLGLTVFANQFPAFLFSIAGGVAADRYNRFNVLFSAQAASLLQALIMSALVLTDLDSVSNIIVLSVLLGIINAFEVPARQAMLYDMVEEKEHLPNAIALNSSTVHVARLIGPAISGIIMERLGAASCFMINALSFVPTMLALVKMKLPPYKRREHHHKVLDDLRQGLKYLKATPSISHVMLMLAIVSLISLPYITLLPVYARHVYHGQASTFGYLNSFVGLGALAGAIFLASLPAGANLKKVLFLNTLVFGVGLAAFSYTESLPLALVFVAVAGFGMMSQTTISNTLIQTNVAPAMRGRVISYYAMAFFGMQPLGALLIGMLSEEIGAPRTVLLEGIGTAIVALAFLPFLRKRELRPAHKTKMEQLEERSIETT
ncbi:MAG TPA: MFS transporter [Chryseosolibacter sp.]|nr:MFS transporter [Chryseosolibacter sp.]